MNTVIKYVVGIIVGLMIISLGGISIWQWRESVKYQELLGVKAEELQQANLEIGKAHTQLLDQKVLHERAMADLSDQLQAEIKKYKSLVTMYTQLEAAYSSERQKVSSLTSTIEELLKVNSLADLPVGRLFYKRDDGTLSSVRSLKWSYQDFRIDLDGEAVADGLNPDQTIKIVHNVNFNIHLKFRAKIVKTSMPNKVDNYYGELYEIGPDGQDLGKLTLTKFEVVESKTLPKKMMWWNPHLDLGIGAGGNLKKGFTGLAEMGFSAMGYGRTKNDLDWRFVRFGVGLSTSKGFTMTFSPVQYNIGGPLPLVSNIWLTPYAGYDFGLGAFHFGLGVSVVF